MPSLGKRQHEEQAKTKSLTVFPFRFIRYAFPGLLPENSSLSCYGNFSLSLIILHTVCWTPKQNGRFPQNKPGTFRMVSDLCQALSIPQQASCTEEDKVGGEYWWCCCENRGTVMEEYGRTNKQDIELPKQSTGWQKVHTNIWWKGRSTLDLILYGEVHKSCFVFTVKSE